MGPDGRRCEGDGVEGAILEGDGGGRLSVSFMSILVARRVASCCVALFAERRERGGDGPRGAGTLGRACETVLLWRVGASRDGGGREAVGRVGGSSLSRETLWFWIGDV